MGNDRRVRGKRRMGTECLAERSLGRQLQERGSQRKAAWSHTRPPADESAGGEEEDRARDIRESP